MKNNFKVYLPLESYDQDAEPIATDNYLIVCDGLGGDGSSTHYVNGNTQEIRKSAYLGSRKLSKICDAFYLENYENLLSESNVANSVNTLKSIIKTEFNQYLLQNPKADVSTGGGVFPTTLASAIFKEVEDGIQTTLIWAGDSRAFIFDLEKGLQQISKDDVIGEFDACFGKDCRMGNCISQDVDFKLNYATFILPKKCVLFVCSDGCFDFMPTPIHFEFEIMRALYSAQNLNESFEKSIRAMNAGDDCTMAGCVFNIEIPEFQAFIQKRIKYIAQMKNAIDNSDAIYEKYVEKNKVEIRNLNLENRKLNSEVFIQIQKLILDTFKNDIENSQIPDYVIVSNVLRSYKPYNELISSVFEERNIVATNIKNSEECKYKYKELVSLVTDAEKTKRKTERSKTPQIFNIVTSVIPGLNNDYTDVERAEKNRDIAYRRYLNNISNLEDKLKNIKEVRGEYQSIRFSCTNLMDELLRSLECYEKSEDNLNKAQEEYEKNLISEEEVNTSIMPIVIKNGVSIYRGYLDDVKYFQLQHSYEEYKRLADILNSLGPNSLHLKSTSDYVNEFKNNFLKIHSGNMFDIIKNNVASAKFITSLAQYQENEKKLAQFQMGLNKGEEIKKEQWNKYRVDYELYKKCIVSGGV